MLIQIEMGPDFPATIARLGSMGRAVLEAADSGLAKGAKLAAGKVVSEYLTGQSLKRRSGNLARSVDGWREGPLEAAVGVRPASAVEHYKWLLTDEQHTILPTGGRRSLTIPIGEALDPRGVARFESVLDAEQQLGTDLFRLPGTKVLGYKKGKTGRGRFRPLFALVKSVLVQGSGALYDGVNDSLDDITGTMQKEIDAVTGAA